MIKFDEAKIEIISVKTADVITDSTPVLGPNELPVTKGFTIGK